MKRAVCSLFALIFLVVITMPTAAAQSSSSGGSSANGLTNPVVLSSEDIKNVPRADHVRKILRHVVAELKLARKEMPHIFMMYVHRSEADTRHLPKVSITIEQARTSGPALYHVWIVDDVRDMATTQGLVMVLNDNFDLRMDTASVRHVRDRVCDKLAVTVDYHALAEGK